MKKSQLFIILSTLFVPLLSFAAAPMVSVGAVSGMAGSSVDVPISFDPAGKSVSGVQFSLILPSALKPASVHDGAAAKAAAKSVTASPQGKKWNFLVFGLNQNAIGSGQLLTASVQIPKGTVAGSYPVRIQKIVLSDAAGKTVKEANSQAGSIQVK